MSKIYIGDYVYHERHRENGTVIGDRGGYVGRYLITSDKGEQYHASSRDLVVIKPARPFRTPSRATIEQKLDLLLEHFGLEIDETIRIVKKQSDEEASN